VENAARNKSRFVTVLGWFAVVVGGISLPIRLLQLIAVAAHPDALHGALSERAHPAEVFAAENLVLMATVYLLASALLLLVGAGLIRRRAWALPAGGALLLIGAFRQAGSLVVVLSGSSSAVAGLRPEVAQQATSIVTVAYLTSLLWLAFLLWFFRRPSIRSEFTSQGSAA
jgi:hypothetical protein